MAAIRSSVNGSPVNGAIGSKQRTRKAQLAWLLSLTGVLGLLLPLRAGAEIRSGQDVVLGPSEIVNEDLYVFARTVTIQGKVAGDVVVFASDVSLEGPVGGDVLAAGGKVKITGDVQGSIRVASGQAFIDGKVGRDVSAMGGKLAIGPLAQIGHDLLAAGGNVEVQGRVEGGLLGGIDSLTLAGPVGHKVQVEVGKLRVEPRARLMGGLSYRSHQKAVIAPEAGIQGPVEQLPPRVQHGPRGPILAFYGWLRALIGLFGLGLAFVLLFPEYSRRTMGTLRQSPWASLGFGTVALVVTPFAAALLFLLGAFIGGWWLGLMLLALYAIGLALSFPVAGMFAGRWLLDRFGRTAVHLLAALLLGLAVLTLVGRVPILGALVMLTALLFGLGALLLAAFRGSLEHSRALGAVG